METREEMIARWESKGWLVPECVTCQANYYEDCNLPCEVFAPRHKASDRCESGQHEHCACDVCF